MSNNFCTFAESKVKGMVDMNDNIIKAEQGMLFEPKELSSPLEAIRETDAEGRDWWNSRKLARVLGYGKYWNFEHLMQKIITFMQQDKGLNIQEHTREIEEMVPVGAGPRMVKSVLLSRVLCHAIITNADKRKPMVRMAADYFVQSMSDEEMSIGITSNMLMYRTAGGKIEVQVIYSQDALWLSQQRMAALFGVDVSTINYHIQQLASSGEINMSEVIRKIPIASEILNTNDTYIYKLDAVIAVGYRVNSYEATQFRIWATSVLKEYLTKGFVLNDERLKGKDPFGADYFDDLLVRIREIRTSESRFYQKIAEIYMECSSDYDKDAEVTHTFYATVQNMMHWAATRQTAAEIIATRADATKPHMGLMTWKRAPEGRIHREDVTIAKNYLSEKELSSLNLLSTSFLNFAELKAERHQIMTMKDWMAYLKQWLEMSDHEVLQDAGKVSSAEAEQHAIEQYEQYRKIQDQQYVSDFDRFIKELPLFDEK